MSQGHGQGPSLPKVPAPPPVGQEHLPTKTIALVLIGALVLFTLGVLWADAAKNTRARQLIAEEGKVEAPTQVGQGKMGLVEQELFEVSRTAEKHKAEKEAWLHGYGWVNRDQGLIHIPIEKAMEQYAAEQKR